MSGFYQHVIRGLAHIGCVTAFSIASAYGDGEFEKLDAHIESKYDWDEAKEHWAFRKPESSGLPTVENAEWPSRRIDYFILSGLEAQSLSPARPMGMVPLLRRLSFDLTGLPPEPGWLNDLTLEYDSGLYSDYVERLLNSRAFGERMASLWMNLARYAEDQAHQVGNDTKHFYPNAYRYREWVVEAFNRDLPYDDFIRLQLAADHMDLTDPGDIRALGFLGLGPKYYNRGRLEVQADEWEDRVDTVTRSFLGLTVACARCHDHKYDPITTEDYYSLAGVFASTDMVNAHWRESGLPISEEDKKTRLHELHIVKDGTARNLPVFLRGQVDNKGMETPRRFLRLLSNGPAQPFTQGSGRLELSEHIADASNPLTARVYVNRVWGLFFGRPLVETASNFGELGSEPSHPKLLDDLSVRFIESGWSTKWLVRELVYSSTYLQRSLESSLAAQRDPENIWLSHMNRKRKTVEMWRDSVLVASGRLDRTGGESQELSSPDHFRRTLYSRISRLELNDFLMQFDYPDANVHSGDRATTITPTQKLFALNSDFIMAQAEAMTELLEHCGTPHEMVRMGFVKTFFREPDAGEMNLSLDFISDGQGGVRRENLVAFAHSLLISNEMTYVD